MPCNLAVSITRAQIDADSLARLLSPEQATQALALYQKQLNRSSTRIDYDPGTATGTVTVTVTDPTQTRAWCQARAEEATQLLTAAGRKVLDQNVLDTLKTYGVTTTKTAPATYQGQRLMVRQFTTTI